MDFDCRIVAIVKIYLAIVVEHIKRFCCREFYII